MVVVKYKDKAIVLTNVVSFKPIDTAIKFWRTGSDSFDFTFPDQQTAEKAFEYILDRYNIGATYIHLK